MIVAKERGLFAKYGMAEVTVVKQASWNAVRRNLSTAGSPETTDGAHIMSSLAYLIHTGRAAKGTPPVPLHILARLNTNGQAISVLKALMPTGAKLDSSPLKAVFAAKQDNTVAMTFRGGTHDLWLRYWLAAGGINPAMDVKVLAAPPPEMVENMRIGIMDVFCAGEPLNQQLVNQSLGYTACVTGEIWRDHPEKSLCMRADWVAKHPRAAVALTAAVIEAQIWADTPANRPALAEILGDPTRLNAPAEDILPRTQGDIAYGDGRTAAGSPLRMKFWADNASYPFQSHDLWFLTEGVRWGLYPQDIDAKALVAAVNREDLWRNAAKMAGAPAGPAGKSRGVETFFDGKVFDPADPAAYLASLPIKSLVA